MYHDLFTSESVAIGHPDKVADQISDAILDACLQQDPYSRVACETLVGAGLVVIAGEITTHAQVDYREIARNTIHDIGYIDSKLGFDYKSCGIITSINKQSPEIAAGVGKENDDTQELGAGDQGFMFGYACDETPELMPFPIMLAHRIVRQLKLERESGRIPYLRPDAKAQVTVQYNNSHHTPIKLHTVVVSTQHDPDVDQKTIAKDMRCMVEQLVPADMLDPSMQLFINPSGSFIQGGPASDCGVTGRKIIVDTYGGASRHGGGAFSGKDPTKVDRSGAYAARYAAKNIVAAGLAKRCEVQIAYAIGRAEPVSFRVETFGTAQIDEDLLNKAASKVFSFTPRGIINTLQLRRPIYRQTAFGGHFGRDEIDFTWEHTDRVAELRKAAGIK